MTQLVHSQPTSGNQAVSKGQMPAVNITSHDPHDSLARHVVPFQKGAKNMRLRVFKQLSQINILREEEVQDLKATVLEFFFKKSSCSLQHSRISHSSLHCILQNPLSSFLEAILFFVKDYSLRFQILFPEALNKVWQISHQEAISLGIWTPSAGHQLEALTPLPKMKQRSLNTVETYKCSSIYMSQIVLFVRTTPHVQPGRILK